MTNDDLADLLRETADLIELTGGNPYRARAFNRAARRLSALDDPAADRLQEGTLTDVEGIGEAMAEHIADLIETGTFSQRDELLNAVPPGLLDVLRVKGLGTKRVRKLWNELDIASLDQLEDAAKNDRLVSLDGFGQKTQANVLKNVRQLRVYATQWRLAEAWSAASSLLDTLRALDAVVRAEPTGALRRRCETVEHVDLIVATESPAALRDWGREALDEASKTDTGAIQGVLPDGLPVRLYHTSPSRFGTEWWRTTGSPAHREAFEGQFGSPAAHADEEAIFSSAGCPPIAPPLREGRGEVDAAKDGNLPSLVSVDDLHGCLHNHSTYSDGSDSLRDMAAAARSMGFSYFGICDHSQSLRIADGLPPDEVRRQQDEIRQINDDLAAEGADFRVVSGIESDILKDGSLDYDEDILVSFDIVVASVHTGFNMTKAEATERVVRAVRNPYTRILGHPTGRLLLSREGYPLDHARVINACAEEGVAIELNANPYRLDLDWRWVRRATDQGVLISINPDAHATDELEYVKWGVAVGQKGWLTAEQCLNAKSRTEFAEWVEAGSPEA